MIIGKEWLAGWSKWLRIVFYFKIVKKLFCNIRSVQQLYCTAFYILLYHFLNLEKKNLLHQAKYSGSINTFFSFIYLEFPNESSFWFWSCLRYWYSLFIVTINFLIFVKFSMNYSQFYDRITPYFIYTSYINQVLKPNVFLFADYSHLLCQHKLLSETEKHLNKVSEHICDCFVDD